MSERERTGVISRYGELTTRNVATDLCWRCGVLTCFEEGDLGCDDCGPRPPIDIAAMFRGMMGVTR